MDSKPKIKDSSKAKQRLSCVLVVILIGFLVLAGCRHIRVSVEIASPDASVADTVTPTAPSPSPTFTKHPESVRLTYDPTEHSQPALSPDGQTVVFISNRAGRPDIFRTSVTGGELSNLTWTPAAQEDTPVFSPDGMTVAFASDRDGDWSLYLMDTDGGNVRPALGGDTGTDEVHPAFTPDGKALAFSSNRADGNWDIYIAAIGNDEWTRLTTHPAVERFPTLSANGKTIAFRSERDGNSEIYLMDADGANLRRLTHHSAFDYYPSLTPDGRGLVFASNRSGKWNTYVADLTSGEVIALEQREGWEMDYPRLSSDGRWLVYAGGRTGGSLDIYLREFVNPFLD
jgi:TolB protein